MRFLGFVFLILSQLWLCQPAPLKESTSAGYPVKYVVVLMMENRSFDHFLGFLKRNISAIDGLNGNETQPYNTSDPNSKVIKVNENGFDTGPDDPCHSFNCITEQVYGYAKPVNQTATPKMNGFVQNAVEQGHTDYNPISEFNETKLPILSTLAEQFVVFDHWFCSAPTPTNPNRAYVMSGTSNGYTDNSVPTNGWPQQTHFEQVALEGKSWRIYYSDDPWAATYFHNLREPQNLQYIIPIENLWRDITNGNMSDYTFIEPRMSTSPNGPSNWQHPDDSVREGEALYKQLYETLRSSPIWNEMVLVITYDEHGGFYDHVPPPQTGVPSPDNVVSPEGFKFDRLGVRIPTLVISPWVAKGLVVHEPSGAAAPTPTSQYDSTSIIASVNRILGIKPPQNPRVTWAGTWDYLLLNMTTPRTDCPMKLPNIAPAEPEEYERMRKRKITDHEEMSIKVLCEMNKRGPDCGQGITKSEDMYPFVTSEWEYYRYHAHELFYGKALKE